MAEPLGITALAITVIQGGYNAYQAFKLTRSFGEDFRNLHRKLQMQMVIMRTSCFFLRQETVLRMQAPSIGMENVEKHLLESVKNLVADISMNVDICNNLAKAHLELLVEHRPIAPHAKEPGKNAPPVSSQGTRQQPPPNKGTFRIFLRKINPMRIFNTQTKESSKTAIELNKKTSLNHPGEEVPLSGFDETAVTRRIESEKKRAGDIQKNASLKTKLRWGHKDRQSFVDSLNMIVNDVRELRLLIEDFIRAWKISEDPQPQKYEVPSARELDDARIRKRSRVSPRSISYTSDSSVETRNRRFGRNGKVKALSPISDSVFQCQETFHQVCSDMGRLLPDSPKDSLYVKLYFDHHRTWEEFRPYQGVNVRNDSLVFMFQFEGSLPRVGSRLLVVDAPVLQPMDREGFESENDLRRLLSQRFIKRPMLQDSFEFEEFGMVSDEFQFACIGSLKAGFPRTSQAPDKLLNDVISSQNPTRIVVFDWERNIDTSSDKAYRITSHDTLEAISRSDFGGLTSDIDRTNSSSSFANRGRRSDDMLNDTEKEQLKKPVLHHIYQDRYSAWTKHTTLEKLLGERRHCRIEFAYVHLQLAMLLSMSYVSLGSKGEARVFRPEDVTYFVPGKPEEEVVHEDLILSPFLRLRPRRLRHIGNRRGVISKEREATLELGLLLFQIGSWRLLDYTNSQGLHKLVRFALLNISEVVSHAGPALAIIVHKCLTGDDRYQTFSITIEHKMLHQWPRYGARDDYAILKKVLQDAKAPGKRYNRRALSHHLEAVLSARLPMNEVLDIMFYIIKPLQKLLPDLNAIGESYIQYDLSSIQTVVVGREEVWERGQSPEVFLHTTDFGSSSTGGDTEEVVRTEVPERYSEEIHWDDMKSRLGISVEPTERPHTDNLQAQRRARRAQRQAQKVKHEVSVTASKAPLTYANRVIGRDSEGNELERVEF